MKECRVVYHPAFIYVIYILSFGRMIRNQTFLMLLRRFGVIGQNVLMANPIL